MAGQVGLNDILRTDEWMDRRRRQLAGLDELPTVGGVRKPLPASFTTLPVVRGSNGAFADIPRRTSDQTRGLLFMKSAAPAPTPPSLKQQPRQSAPIAPARGQATSSYFGYQGEADDAEMRDLRRQQGEAHVREGKIDRQNRWMLAPVAAPVAVVVGSEIAGSLSARAMLERMAAARGVPARAFEPVRGENSFAAAGRAAHRELQAKVEAKQGWDAERKVDTGDGEYIRPDAQTPRRNPENPNKRYYIDRKPNTKSGRKSGEQKKRDYNKKTENKTRILLYDPKDYM